MALYISFWMSPAEPGQNTPGKFISSAKVTVGSVEVASIPANATFVELHDPDEAAYIAMGGAAYTGAGANTTFAYLPLGETRRYEVPGEFRGGKLAYKTVS